MRFHVSGLRFGSGSFLLPIPFPIFSIYHQIEIEIQIEMASTLWYSSRPFTLTRITDMSPNHNHPFHSPQLPPSLFFRRRRQFLLTSSCHVDGDDVVSTRNSTFDRGFTVIANLLRRIKPLDNSVISKGVSDSSKDSMKQTISTMLGLLPSDQFDVTVKLSLKPLHRLLVSSIITG